MVISCLVGWWVCCDLIRIGGGAAALNPLLEQACGTHDGAMTDCLAVLRSPRASLRLGPITIPWSALGAGYFCAVGLWWLFVGRPLRRRLWSLVAASMVVFGALISARLAYVLLTELRRPCIGCLTVHGLNALILLCALIALWPQSSATRAALPSRGHGWAALTAAGLALLIHILAVSMFIRTEQATRLMTAHQAIITDPAFVRWRFETQPVHEMGIRDDELSIGDPAARNVVVAYVDLQCEHCKEASTKLATWMSRHPAALRVVYRHYPQDPACNPAPSLRKGGFPDACAAADAVEAVRRMSGPDAGVRYLKTAYEQSRDLPRRPFAQWAAGAGLSATEFQNALIDPAVRKRVLADIESAQKLGVQVAPTLFLNGRKLEYWNVDAVWPVLLGIDRAP